jgi:RNA polymerase sigma-70 factor (ECF subfamily)
MSDGHGDTVLSAAAAGEEWAVVQLYRDIHPGVLRYLRHAAPTVAEDLASDVWIALAGQLDRVTGGIEGARKLAFTIARRRLIDDRRRQRRRRTDLVGEVPAPTASAAVPPEIADRVADELTAQEAVAALAGTLPRDWAEVVVLRVVSGLSTAEVAAIMGKSEGAVRVMQHRALSRLAAHLPGEVVTP